MGWNWKRRAEMSRRPLREMPPETVELIAKRRARAARSTARWHKRVFGHTPTYNQALLCSLCGNP